MGLENVAGVGLVRQNWVAANGWKTTIDFEPSNKPYLRRSVPEKAATAVGVVHFVQA